MKPADTILGMNLDALGRDCCGDTCDRFGGAAGVQKNIVALVPAVEKYAVRFERLSAGRCASLRAERRSGVEPRMPRGGLFLADAFTIPKRVQAVACCEMRRP